MPYRWVCGLAIAVVALATTATLIRTEVALLLPIARFTGMAWLIAAGFFVSNPPAESRPRDSTI